MAGGADRTHSSGPPASPHPSSRPLHQVTYVSLGSFVWTCILSYASSPPPAATARGAAAECEPVMEVCEVPLEPPPGGLSTDDLGARLLEEVHHVDELHGAGGATNDHVREEVPRDQQPAERTLRLLQRPHCTCCEVLDGLRVAEERGARERELTESSHVAT